MKIDKIEIGLEYIVHTNHGDQSTYTGKCIGKAGDEVLIRDDSGEVYAEGPASVLKEVQEILPLEPRKKWLGLF